MSFSVESKIKDIYENEEARKVLERCFPKLTRMPSFQMTLGMSFQTLSRFPQWTLNEEQPAAADSELRSIQ